MRNVFRPTSALLVLGIALLGCSQSADAPPTRAGKSARSAGEADNTVLAGSSKVVLTIEGMS